MIGILISTKYSCSIKLTNNMGIVNTNTQNIVIKRTILFFHTKPNDLTIREYWAATVFDFSEGIGSFIVKTIAPAIIKAIPCA